MPSSQHDLQQIHRVIGRTRRRLRFQAALEAWTLALIPGLGFGLVVLWLWRMELITDQGAQLAVAGLAGLAFVAGVIAALRRFPADQVATRVDRASGLSSRLSTACDFTDKLARDKELHPATVALMEAAISDGVAAASRADVKRSAPFRAPPDLKPALAFMGVSAVIVLLAFSPVPHLGADPSAAATLPGRQAPEVDPADRALASEDLEYTRELVDDMRRVADETGDPNLDAFAKALDELLDQAERGELSKEELLAKMEALEKQHMEGKDADVDKMLEDLKETGKELKKEKLTKELGEALEKGDLEKAKKEMEKLAEKLDKKELSPEDQKKLAEALEKAAKKLDQKQQEKDQQAQKQIDKKKEEVRRLEKKLAQKPQDEELKRRLEREKRELEKLERDKKDEQDKNAQNKRQLERLSRNLKSSAENLKNQKQEASQNLKDSAQDTQKIEDEIRKVQNQKKAQSQLSDLKDALRRAKPGKGQQGNQGRAQRMKDFMRRAGGQRGNGQAWKPGQRGQGQGQGQQGQASRMGQGQKGLGQGQGQGQNQPGQGQQPGDGIGDEHDPNLMGDPTARYGQTKEQELDGKHGRGPSRKETILTSAKKGFAHASYKKVYADYQKIVEEVMNQEKVPQGYKYYVKRYFQRIKPRAE